MPEYETIEIVANPIRLHPEDAAEKPPAREMSVKAPYLVGNWEVAIDCTDDVTVIAQAVYRPPETRGEWSARSPDVLANTRLGSGSHVVPLRLEPDADEDAMLEITILADSAVIDEIVIGPAKVDPGKSEMKVRQDTRVGIA
jgi:hypothetical protein